MVTLLATGGFALLAFYLGHPERLPEGWTIAGSADKLFPHFLSSQLPAGCAGLVISAFLCDAIQTLEAGVNSTTAVITNDLLPERYRQKEARRKLFQARIFSAVIAIIVSLNAVFVANLAISHGLTIIDLMPRFFNLFVGPLAGLFFVGMFLPRCTSRSISLGVLSGILVSVLWAWGKDIFQLQAGPTILLAIAVPCLTTVLGSALFSLFLEDGKPHPGQEYTWWNVVKKAESLFGFCSIPGPGFQVLKPGFLPVE